MIFLMILPVVLCRVISYLLFAKVKRTLSDKNTLNLDMLILAKLIKHQRFLLFFSVWSILEKIDRLFRHGNIFKGSDFEGFVVYLMFVGIIACFNALEFFKNDFKINDYKFRLRLSFADLFFRSFLVSATSVAVCALVLMLIWFVMHLDLQILGIFAKII